MLRRLLQLGRVGCAAAVVAAGLLAAPAEGRAGDLGLEYYSGGQHSYAPSFDAFGRGETPNVYGSDTLVASYQAGTFVGLDGLHTYAAFTWEVAGGPRFDKEYNFAWDRQLYLVGFDYRYPLTPAVRPFARIAVGAGHQTVEVGTPDGTKFSQSRLQFATRGTLGLELRTPYKSGDDSDSEKLFALAESFSLGVTARIGYLWQPSTYFSSLTSETVDSDDDPWQRSGIDLGRLDTSGWFWAFGATMRFRL